MAGPRPGRKTVELVCLACQKKFLREEAEHNRNVRLGRAELCTRKCWASYVNKTPNKLKQTLEMLAANNSNQYGADNANWRGGVSETVWGKKPKQPPEG